MEETFRRIIREELERIVRLQHERRVADGVEAVGASCPLVSVTVAAAQFGLSAKTITRWRDERRLTPYGKGRLARVDPAEVRRVMLDQATKGDEKREPSDAELHALLDRKLGRVG